LFEDGYLNGKTFKEGLYPEKNVYKINDKGKEHFAELMEHFSTNVPHIYLDMNAFIWNIENLNYEDGLKHLNNLKSELNSIKYWISQHEKEVENHLDFAGRSIVRQHRMMIDTLYEWIEGVIVEFNNRKENE
jgi:DNA-binding PadR family transcriptional regulator